MPPPRLYRWDLLIGRAGAALVATPLSPLTFDELMQPFAALPISPSDPISAALPATQCMLVPDAARTQMIPAGP